MAVKCEEGCQERRRYNSQSLPWGFLFCRSPEKCVLSILQTDPGNFWNCNTKQGCHLHKTNWSPPVHVEFGERAGLMHRWRPEFGGDTGLLGEQVMVILLMTATEETLTDISTHVRTSGVLMRKILRRATAKSKHRYRRRNTHEISECLHVFASNSLEPLVQSTIT